MGKVEKLGDLFVGLVNLDHENTIYAEKPWTEQSMAIVIREPDSGGLPVQVVNDGMKYLLEVDIPRNFIEDWIGLLGCNPSVGEICNRVIYYAVYDA